MLNRYAVFVNGRLQEGSFPFMQKALDYVRSCNCHEALILDSNPDMYYAGDIVTKHPDDLISLVATPITTGELFNYFVKGEIKGEKDHA